MSRFVFRKKCADSGRSVADLAQQATRDGATVLSQTATLLLLDCSAAVGQALSGSAPDFVFSAEVRHELPSPPQVKLRRPPR